MHARIALFSGLTGALGTATLTSAFFVSVWVGVFGLVFTAASAAATYMALLNARIEHELIVITRYADAIEKHLAASEESMSRSEHVLDTASTSKADKQGATIH